MNRDVRMSVRPANVSVDAASEISSQATHVQDNPILKTLGKNTAEVKSTEMYLRGRTPLISDRKIDSYEAVRAAFRAKQKSRVIHVHRAQHFFSNLVRILRAPVFVNAVTIMDLVSDLFFCILYLYDIQWALNNNGDPALLTLPGPSWLWISRLQETFNSCFGFSVYNIVSWLLFITFADNGWKAFFSTLTIINCLTSIPFIVAFQFAPARYVYIPYFLRSIVCIARLQKVLRLRDLTRYINFSPVAERTIMLSVTLFTIMYIGQCTFQYVEFRFAGRNLNIFSAFYFIVVTLSTVGYGDIAPSCTAGQVVVVLLILTALIFLPNLINSLIEAINEQRRGEGGVFTRGKASYCVVIGHLDKVTTVTDVLESLLDRQSKHIKVVLLGRKAASPAINAIITSYKYKDRVTYLVGSGMEKSDLERAQVSFAPDVPLYVNNLLPDTESYQDLNVDASMCIDDLKQLVLGLTVMYDGASTLLINLIHTTYPEAKYDQLWEAQYGDGFGNKIHSVPVNKCFIGMLFNQASWFTFREFQINMIGVRTSHMSENDKNLVLNPGASYRLAEGDEIVFVAQSEVDVKLFNDLSRHEFKSMCHKFAPHGSYADYTITLPQSRVTLNRLSQKRASSHLGTYLGVPGAPYEDSTIPHCSLASTPSSLDEMLVESAADWQNHVIVCSGDFNVFKFLCSLSPTEAEFQILSVFPNINFMIGDPRQKSVLANAGLEGCRSVVIMNMGSYGAGEFAGSSAIMISHLIFHMHPDKSVILEATRRNLINYLNPTPTTHTISYRRRLRAAVNQVEKSVGFGQEESVPLMAKEKSIPGEVSYQFTPVFAAGRVVVAPMLISLLFQLHRNPCLLEIFLMLCGVDSGGDVAKDEQASLGMTRSWLGQIRVPEMFSILRPTRIYTSNTMITMDPSHKIERYNAIRATFRKKHLQFQFQGREFDLLWDKLSKAIEVRQEGFLNGLALMDLVSDLFFCILYMIDIEWAITNHADVYLDTLPGPAWLWIARPEATFFVCCAFSIFSIISWLFYIGFADNRAYSIFSVLTLINILSALPFMFGIWHIPARSLYIPYFLRSIVVLERLKKVLRLRDLTKHVNFSAVAERTIMLCAALMTLMYIGMCTFQYTEFRSDGRNYNIFDSFYFIVVTLATVGYGDIAPTTPAGQAVVICLILTALIILPQLVNALIGAIGEQRTGREKYFVRGQASYSVVLGNFEKELHVTDVLEARLSITSERAKREKIVLMGRSAANQQVQGILASYKYKDRVTYLVGSGMEKSDLERAQVGHANAVYILAYRGAPEHRREDQKNTLRAWAIHNYAPSVPLYVNNLLPDTSSYQDSTVTSALCVDDLKQLVLGLSVMYSGASTLLINLIHITLPEVKHDHLWEAQYGDGFENKIYVVPINSNFIGMPFNEASLLVFREFEICMIGVRIFHAGTSFKSLVLNPGASYRLSSNDDIVFIAQSEVDVQLFSKLTRDFFEKNIKCSSANAQHFHTPPTQDRFLSPGTCLTPARKRETVKKITNRKSFVVDELKPVIFLGVPEAPYEDTTVPQCCLVLSPLPLDKLKVESAVDWEGHLLVCTGNFNLFKFLCSLRSSHLENHHRILLLAARGPTKEEFDTLSVFPDVYFMVGDPEQQRVLFKAGIRGCLKVVVMNMGSNGSGEFAGSSAIMISHLIYHMYKRSLLVKKVVHIEAAKLNLINFLQPTPTTSFSIKGNSSLFPHSRAKPADLVEVEERNIPGEVSYFYTPVFAAGRVVVAPMLVSLLFQLQQNPCLLEVFLMLCGVEREMVDESAGELRGVSKSWMSQIPVPPAFLNGTYGELYYELSFNQGIVPLGIYRDVTRPLRNKLPFVFTNPLSEVVLMEGDLIFVLAP
ncbi:potassium channel, sub T, member 2 [Podochytrium sp. JEL0797]|nr:potassium channel, sub T, member 2 [Podochytrium sp. JEL0797]